MKDDSVKWPRKCLAGTGEIIVQKMKPTKLSNFNSISSKEEQRLLTTLKSQGYLYLKHFLPVEVVEEARSCVLDYLVASNWSDSNETILDSTAGREDNTNLKSHADTPSFRSDNIEPLKEIQSSPALLTQQQWIEQQPSLKKCFEHEQLYSLFRILLQSKAITCHPHKWLRAVGRHKFTGLHNDRYYLDYIPAHILTAWIPLQDMKTANGTMIVAPKNLNSSSTLKRLQMLQKSLKKGDLESGWIASDPNTLDCRIEFVASDFDQGDIVVLDLDIFHMTAANCTDRWRISCDTRWISMDSLTTIEQ